MKTQQEIADQELQAHDELECKVKELNAVGHIPTKEECTIFLQQKGFTQEITISAIDNFFE